VQGLGAYPIVLSGSRSLCDRYLGDVIMGRRIAGFALTEPEAGSDAASLRTTATKEEDGWVLEGEKTLISNVPIAQYYVVFANADPAAGRKGITAFVVENGTPGLTVASIPMSIPHPIGRLRFERCRVPDDARVGEVGGGFKLAMQTLDAFRISVGAAANGMATAALSRAIDHVTRRRQFGAPLAEQQLVRAYIADMATELDAARLLVARAAHLRDQGERTSTEAAMAKMYATEAAQRIIDHAVQLHGGSGVIEGSEVERLYREIRPLRIYEGTTEIQKMIIAKGVLAARS
jgi:acyl-CoA dehydrogenase